ncbi:BTAD domain-containing putative transcriptional regulator [Actinoplanes sp. NPDC051861]|uniref:AfsR/SARP family transcriptional regulator n=1 Tax=Actinoplanes sp. NPDC051861 TaxID=3155170 RepID=UPI00341AA35C
MEFVVLGPVGLFRNGRPVPMARPQQATVLAALAVDARRVVSVGTLIDRVWGSEPPSAARRSLQAHLARLNQALPAGALIRRGGGYQLDVEPRNVDVHRFTSLVSAARAERDPLRQIRHYEAALSLWQGTPMAGVPGVWASRMRAAWTRQHLDALSGWACVKRELGLPQEALTPLSEAVRDHPGAEPVVGELMRALHASGQTAEALARYAALREHLAEELGAEPGAPLQEIHLALLRAQPFSERPAASRHPLPAGMPSSPPVFVGRTAELRQLTALLPENHNADTRTVVVSGMAGVGKTTIAVHWAHQIADRFPDGQLYLNMRGFDPRDAAMTPSEALLALLEALGAEAHRVPSSLDGKISLYRSFLAGRRVLILLDNVREAGHIRPLLPGTPGCFVLATSRRRLTTLVATEGASSLTVGPLTVDEARAMLTHRLETARIDSAPAAVERLVASCAGLPLAVALVAARAATQPELGLADLAGQLPGGQSLDTFEVGDPALSMRTVFSWSYQALTPAAARLFRLLGLNAGHTVSGPAAASLTGLSPSVVRGTLAELTQAHLLTEVRSGRYVMHDLLRAYAVELVHEFETEADRIGAARRLLDHYLHSVEAAGRMLRPDHRPVSLPLPDPDAVVQSFADDRAAFAWLADAHPMILASATQAAEGPASRPYAWRLVLGLENFIDWTGRWQEFQSAQIAALGAARKDRDVEGQAHCHRSIARTYCRTDRLDDALQHLHEALDLFRAAGLHSGVIDTHRSMAVVLNGLNRDDEGFEHEYTSLRLATAAGDDAAQALANNNLAFHYALLGRAEQAVPHGEQALRALRRIGARNGEARALSTLGLASSVLGRHAEAIAYYQQSITIFRTLGDRVSQAEMLTRFGDALQAAGDRKQARESWQAALQIFDSWGSFDLLGRYDRVARIRQRAEEALQPPAHNCHALRQHSGSDARA